MSSKLRVFGCAALCVALSVGTAFALPVQIVGADGVTKKYIYEITDIVGFTTGTHNVPQESFLKVLDWTGDWEYRFIPVKGNVDGSNVTLSQTGDVDLNAHADGHDTGLHPALSTKKDKDGSFYLLIPTYSATDVRAHLFKVGLDGDKITQTSVWGSSNLLSFINDGYVTDAAGGLFPYGKDGREVFVIAYFTSDDRILLIDLNPWGEPTDPLLLRSWDREWSECAGLLTMEPPTQLHGNVDVSF